MVSIRSTMRRCMGTDKKKGIGPNFGVGLLHECGSTYYNMWVVLVQILWST